MLRNKIIAGVISAGMLFSSVPAFALTEDHALDALEAARQKVLDARDAWDSAKMDVEDAEADIAEARWYVDIALDDYNSAVDDALLIVRDEIGEAEADYNEKLSDYEFCKEEADVAKEDYDNVVIDRGVASSALQEAILAKNNAQIQVNHAQRALEKLEEQIEKEIKIHENPGLYYLAENSTTSNCVMSVEVLENYLKDNYVDITDSPLYRDAVNEALSVDNLKRMGEFVVGVNAIRYSNGMGQIYIDYRLMCLAAVCRALSMNENLEFSEIWNTIPYPLRGAHMCSEIDKAIVRERLDQLNPLFLSDDYTHIGLVPLGDDNKLYMLRTTENRGTSVQGFDFFHNLENYVRKNNEAVESADDRRNEATEVVTNAENEYDNAVTEYEEAAAYLGVMQAAAEEARLVWEDLDNEAYRLKRIADNSKAVYDAAQDIEIFEPSTYENFPTVKDAMRYVAEMQNAIDEAEKGATAAQNAYNKAVKARDNAKKAYDDAVKAEEKAEYNLWLVRHRKAGHTWDKGKITKQPTTVTEGIKTYTCTVCGDTKHEHIAKLPKKVNPLDVKGKTVKVTFSKTLNKYVKVTKAITFVKQGKGTITYSKVSGNTNILINKNTGKLTIKKGLKKNTYNVEIKVKAAGNNTYKSAVKTVTVKVRVM